MAALSRATVPGRLDRTIGSDTETAALRRSALRTSLTPFRIRARVELPSRAARDFSCRYIPSGISTVVRMSPLCHIYGAGWFLSAATGTSRGLGCDRIAWQPPSASTPISRSSCIRPDTRHPSNSESVFMGASCQCAWRAGAIRRRTGSIFEWSTSAAWSGRRGPSGVIRSRRA